MYRSAPSALQKTSYSKTYPRLTQNDRLPKLMKQIDNKFDRVEEMLKKARFMMRDKDRSGAKGTVESSAEPED